MISLSPSRTLKALMGCALVAASAWAHAQQVLRVTTIPEEAATEQVRFEGLTAGPVAFRLFHDLNSDNRMNTNPFGIPTEPFAFSNNAPAQFGPAKWDAAKFEVSATGATQTIKLQ